ncbi:response regulator [Ferviditalea candida]|uniref:Response regulator transcription factor n=1 Tax=Ferviditalea candida TaxID=3108399 RepID=A0ABU5ZKS9_9BACL|nr:response regulator transcription factor [Paenibacillaceae bacterium T2]
MLNDDDLSMDLTALARKRKDSIKVVLADRDVEWRNAFASLIRKEGDLTLVDTASSKEEAIRAIEQMEVDVMVMDVMLKPPNRDGLDAAIEIRARKQLPIIFLTAVANPEVMIEAITAGAVNYITKVNSADVFEAIREAHQDKASLHPDIAETIRRELRRLKRLELQSMLTPTEKGILNLIAQGYPQPAMTRLLGITPNMMKTHTRHIARKFGTRTSREAAEVAKRRGLFAINDGREH